MIINHKFETKFGTRSPEALALPYSSRLPDDKASLIRIRMYVVKRCIHDIEFRDDIVEMCSQDLPFFVLMFGWIHETRATEDQIGAFPAYLDPDQIDILAWWQKFAGTYDITNEKTRGIGLSYLASFLVMWLWLHNPHSIDIGLLTRTEKALDQKAKPGSLMGKLDLMFKKLPYWMRHDRNGKTILRRVSSSQNHLFQNLANGNNITGYVPTNNDLRSDRLNILIVDEGRFLKTTDQEWFAATFGAVPSTIWISTHQGTDNMFYRMTKDDESRLVRISTWWWENRRCRRGLYTIEAGQVKQQDAHRYPPGYFDIPKIWKLEEHIKGRLRSKWVDFQLLRPGIEPTTVLEEYYGLSAVASRKVLRPSIVKCIENTAQRPKAVGYLRDGVFIDDPDGDLWLWCNPDRPDGLVGIGVDPALTQASGAYFAAAGFNFKTGDQVFSYRSRMVSNDEFPRIITEIGNFLAGGGVRPMIACESQGPAGNIFLDGAQRLRYPSIAREEGKSSPGYGNNDRGAAWLIEWGRAIWSGETFVRDSRLAIDAEGFEYDADKWDVVFAGRDGHGDLAIAAALAWHEIKKRRQAYIRANQRAQQYDPDEAKFLQDSKRRRRQKCWSDRFIST